MTSAFRTITSAEVELTVELSASDLKAYVAQAEEHLGQAMKIDGFRTGKIPPDVARKHISDKELREEALSVAVDRSLSSAIKSEKLDVLDQSEFAIQENTPEKLVYKIKLSLYPTIELGAYTGIASERKPIEVTDIELEKVLSDIAASRATGEGEAKVIPEVNDAFAKTLGQFDSLSGLKDMVREGLLAEKQDKEKQRIRIDLLNKIIVGSKLEVPASMVVRQLDSLMAGFEEDLRSRGMELPLYLAHLKKTQDELRKDWMPQAETQVKMMLVLHEVAKKENITIREQELQEILEMRLQQYLAGRPGMTPEEMKDMDLDTVKSRLYSELLNKKVFEFIESRAIVS